MQFQSGKLEVFGGVNRINGSYALVSNQSLVLGALTATEMIGPSPQRKIEDEFSSALASVDAFHVEGDRLDLMKGSQVVAVFKSDQP
jgi:heat shock protein HslJ